jgi:CRISPR system Cascade subunit CasE
MCREEPTKPDWVENVNWKMNVVKAGFPFHRYYRFDILANPTQRDKRRDGWNGREPKRRRFTLTEINEQREWFLSKAEEHGFRLLEDSGGQLILDTDPRKDYAFLYRDNSHGLHIGVRYQGALEVTEPKQFREAFTDGIGSAKSFGFGLLLLAPLTLHNQNTGGGIL